MNGNVVWFNNIKGYGFINSKIGQIFLHYTAFKDVDYLEEGDELEFDTIGGEKGLKAINVVKKNKCIFI